MIASKFCPDCGPSGVIHKAEWLSAFFDTALEPFLGVFESIWRTIGGPSRRLEGGVLPALRLLARFQLGTLSDSPDARDNLRTQALWESAGKRGISLMQFRFFRNPNNSVFVARRGSQTRVFDGLPRPERMPSPSLKWMDNKGIMKKKFAAAGIPVAKGKACFTFRQALTTFRSLEKPVIVKPHIGSRSRHTTVHIEDEKALAAAFRKAKQLSPWAVVEEELEGMVFRGSVVCGKLVGVIRREFPYVTGDGKSTVKKLLEIENKNPLRRGSSIFHEIDPDLRVEAELARQGLGWESVPLRGTVVALGPKTSRSQGGTTTDVTEITHPQNIELLEKVAKVLEDSLVGIDFIMKEVSVPWTEQARCGIIECNSLPFLELHHYPYRGEPRDVTGALLQAVFPD